jgi:hypothetical protein
MTEKPKRGDAYDQEKTTTVRRAELSEALSRFIRKNNGSVVSVPNSRCMRIEITRASALALTSKLESLGYDVRHVNTSQRLMPGAVVETIVEHSSSDVPIVRSHSGFADVDVLEISLPGK